MNEEITNAENIKVQKLDNKKIFIIGIVIVAILIIGLISFNTPQKKINKSLELGNKFLIEMNYEQAILEFEKAIAIDERCLQAYVGALEAYVALGNAEEILTFCEKTVELLLSLDEDYILSNKEEFETVKELVIDECLKIVSVFEENQEDEKALKIYDFLIELDITNEKLIESLEEYLNDYIERLKAEKNYDKIRELAEKYSGIVKNINFDEILKSIEEWERFYADLMEYLYSVMKEKKYDELRENYYMEPMLIAHYDISSSESQKYVHMKEDGTGVGIYTFSNDYGNFYVIYQGEYKDGVREGYGVSYIAMGEAEYLYYEGTWKQDKPNGYGEIKGAMHENEDIDISGNFKDGLYDGEMIHNEIVNGKLYDYKYICENGIPVQNKVEDMRREMERATGATRVINDMGIPDNFIIRDYKIIDQYNVQWIYSLEELTLGVWEFADSI